MLPIVYRLSRETAKSFLGFLPDSLDVYLFIHFCFAGNDSLMRYCISEVVAHAHKKVAAVAAGVAWLEAEAGLTAAQRTQCHRAQRLAPLGRKNYVARVHAAGSGRGRGDRFMFSPWEPLWELGKYGNLLSNPAPFRQTFSSFIELSIQKRNRKNRKVGLKNTITFLFNGVPSWHGLFTSHDFRTLKDSLLQNV